ncbi:solute carrier family 35 member F5-like [Actinia tenebrosa]|uniref:Solute carrier family 35 member F5 n=1 Tax=Actinia tenebrosa TaxID=6105 RepID=A0A6P8IBK1_ACTTE|nr:solute carrier family 35 member F5-like [Actinia tenebrosa]
MGCFKCSSFRSCWNSTKMFLISPEESVRRKRRLLLGILVLLLVNVIWVASAELSSYIFQDEGYNKPFFSTYFKTSAFMVYLAGFLFYQPWQYQCLLCFRKKVQKPSRAIRVMSNNGVITPARENSSLLSSPQSSRSSSPGLTQRQYLTESVFEPITDEEISQANENLCDAENGINDTRHVRFNNVREVRHLKADKYSHYARMSHVVSERLKDVAKTASEKINLSRVSKIAVTFCFLWFLATLGYQEALNDTSPAAVNILSSTSGLFTLLLAAVFQSSPSDRFTLSKVCAVVLSICGITMVILSDTKSTKAEVNYGAIWALASAFLYACYLVFLKKKVPDESKIDIPMFFGFVGLFNLVLLWPGFFILHYTKVERFELPPSIHVWGYLTLNAIVGTVVSEFLWLWGCFLTSSLTATLSLSLVIPLTMLVDVFMNRIKFTWLFFVGTLPVVISFFAVSLLTHYPDWDPVMTCLKKCLVILRITSPPNQFEDEQRQNLIEEEEQHDSINQVPT